MSSLAKTKRIRLEQSANSMIPVTTHVAKNVLRTKNGDYVQTFRLSGISWESADDDDINNWHERLNVLLRSIASTNYGIWTHLIRRHDTQYPDGNFQNEFSSNLNAKYKEKLITETLMINELYFSIVYRPQSNIVGSTALKIAKKAEKGGNQTEIKESLEECAKKSEELLVALERYDPIQLGIYQNEEERLYSSLLEFYGFLINGEWQKMPLPRAPLNDVLATTRPLFGSEALEYRMTSRSRIGAILGISQYPTPTTPGMLNELLQAPFSFVLTQSFVFLNKNTALELMKRQYNRMLATDDEAGSQREELIQAMDDLVSNLFVMGDHHFSLQVLAEPYDGVKEAEGIPRLKELGNNIAKARNYMSNAGIVTAREDLAMEAAFWAQLPGNFALRNRKSPITSRNFAALSCFHNYPIGRRRGNYWGDALTMFATSAMTPYYFSLHASDPVEKDGGGRKDVPHTVIFGPNGTGKTTLIGFLVAMLGKFKVTQVIFDKNEGLHILVKALGGTYLTLNAGLPTGCNPLQLPPTQENVEFMKQFLRVLVNANAKPLSTKQEDELDQALRGVLSFEISNRRLSRLIEFLDVTETEGVFDRLRKWCEIESGEYAWVFDNPSDSIVPMMNETSLIGFDVTAFLDNPSINEPITLYLLYLTGKLVDGRRLVCWMDEFAKLVPHPSFANFAKNGLESWRKMNAAFIASTQSTSHVLDSSIARAIVEQTATKIFFPNADADYKEYTEGFSITDQEFSLLKEVLEPGSRSFLIKQGNNSIVVKLDLKNFDFELAVISGRANNVTLMKQLVEKNGDKPEQWLKLFEKAILQ